MAWPTWINDYPGLKQELPELVNMLAWYTKNYHRPPATHSEIRKDAEALQKALQKVNENYMKLVYESQSRALISPSPIDTGNVTSPLNAVAFFGQLVASVVHIEAAHSGQKKQPLKNDPDKMAAERLLLAAMDSGLAINHSNSGKIQQLHDELYIQANRPPPKTHVLAQAKRDVKRNYPVKK